MKRAMSKLLLQLEAIEEQHDGLGDTNVREQMHEHVLHALLRPVPGYQPSGEYGLDPEGNRQVAATLTAFCKSAAKEAQRLGLDIYEQRVAAFQDDTIETPNGAGYNDYFGFIEVEQQPKLPAAPSLKKVKKLQRCLVFDRAGKLPDLLEALQQAGGWGWKLAGGGAEYPHLVTQPQEQATVKIRAGYEKMDADGSITPPEYAFLSVVEAPAEELAMLLSEFQKLLIQVGATRVTEKTSFWW
jgi:hypothetical protein